MTEYTQLREINERLQRCIDKNKQGIEQLENALNMIKGSLNFNHVGRNEHEVCPDEDQAREDGSC